MSERKFYPGVRVMELSGTCQMGSLRIGDLVRVTFTDEEWEAKITQLRPFGNSGWVDWEATGKPIDGPGE